MRLQNGAIVVILAGCLVGSFWIQGRQADELRASRQMTYELQERLLDRSEEILAARATARENGELREEIVRLEQTVDSLLAANAAVEYRLAQAEGWAASLQEMSMEERAGLNGGTPMSVPDVDPDFARRRLESRRILIDAASYTPLSAERPIADPEQLIAEGMDLFLDVSGEPMLSSLYTVNEEGTITPPLIDPVEVVGLTTKAAAALLDEQFAAYVREPGTSVRIDTGARDSATLIAGGIRSAVEFIPGSTLLQVLTSKATMNEGSDWRNVQVIKPASVDRHEPKVMAVDAWEIVVKGDLTQNVVIEQGDIIYVPATDAAPVEVQANNQVQIEAYISTLPILSEHLEYWKQK
jgi:protein involved in polysaccharide export with SLBB domain